MTIKERNARMRETIKLMKAYPGNLYMAWSVSGISEFDVVKEKFDCGAACSIAGFVCVANDPKVLAMEAAIYRAREILGLDKDISDALFTPGSSRSPDIFVLEGHHILGRDIEVAIKALRMAVELQNSRQRRPNV